MTTELEKQFFDTFGIEPKELMFRTMNCACGCHDCKNCEKYKNNFSKTYPQITDRQYLELILVYSEIRNLPICYSTVERFKEGILECFIEDGEDLKHQVQEIFKEKK